MKQFSLSLALALCLGAPASAEYHVNATASFTVGVTHVDKYMLRQAQHDTGGAQHDRGGAQHDTGDVALILVPGLTDSAEVWSGTIAQFAPTHTIYALTLAGFGGNKPAQAPLVDKAVSDIAALIAHEHLNKPVLIGHSLGGFTAIRFAEEHPGDIRGIVAADGLPVYPGFEKMTAAARTAAADQMTGPMAAATSAQFDAFEKANVLPYLTQKTNVEIVAEAGAHADPASSAQYMKELLTDDLRPNLSKITVPLLELVPFDPTLDPYNPQAPIKTAAEKQTYYESLLANDKTAKVELINNSRHFIMYDQPQALYNAITTFLKTLP